jgi:hypothetical protein
MRWWKKLLLVVLALLVIAVASLYYYLFHLNGLERVVSKQLNELIGRSLPLSISIGAIRGNPLNGLVVEDISIAYTDSIGAYKIAAIRRLTAVYSLSNLWRANYVFNYIGLDSVSLTLASDSLGHLRLPKLPTGSGSNRGAVSFRVDQLDVGQMSFALLRPSDTLRFDSINLSTAVQNEESTLSFDIRHLGFKSNRSGINLTAGSGRLTYSDGQIVMQNLSVADGDARLKLSGLLRPAELTGQIEFDVNAFDLERITQLTGVKLDGKIDANGRVNFADSGFGGSVTLGGRFLFAGLENLFVGFHFSHQLLTLDTLYGLVFDQCAIDGKGEVNFAPPTEKYRLDASIRNFDLKRMIVTALPSNLNGTIILDGQSFDDKRLKLDLSVNLYESSFDGYPFQTASGALTVTSDSVTFADGFAVSYFENLFAVSGRIDYSRAMLLNVKAHLGNLDRYKGKLFIDQPGGRAYAEAVVSGRTSDPDLRGNLTSDSLWLYQVYSKNCRIEFDISRFLTRQQGNVSARFLHGYIWGKPYDTAFAELSLDSGLASIDTVFLHNNQTTIISRGSLDYAVYPQQLKLDTLNVHVLDQTLANSGAIHIAVDSLGFNFQQAALSGPGAIARGSGRVNYDESMTLSLSTDRVPVQTWVEMVREDFPVDGYARVKTDISGTFSNPKITLLGAIDSLSYRGLEMGDLNVAAQYSNEMVMIDSLSIKSEKGFYRASGNFGLNLAFTSDSLGQLVQKPMNVSFSGSDQKFDLVSLLVPSVEQLDGDFFADIRLTGTPSEPHLQGEAYLKNGRLKYFDLADIVYTDSAGVTMKDNQIVIEKIEAYVKDPRRPGRKSPALVEGTITVESLDKYYYNVDVNLPREFPFTYELDDIKGVAEGSLHIEGDNPPKVTGDLTLLSMQYHASFAKPEEGSPLMELLTGEQTWDLNINVEILSNYWIKNEDIDGEFAGNMNVIRENGVYRFIGEMDVLRGKGFLFDKTFPFELPSRVLFDNINYLNPTLDILCYTRIPGVARPNDPSREPIELHLHITGTLEKPELNTTPDSPFPREDIIPLIVANYAASDTASARSMTRIEERLTGLVSSQVSQLGSRQLSRLGVETFEIDPTFREGQLDPLGSQVTLGKYVSGMYLYGRSALSGRLGQEIGFEYRLNKEVRLEGKRDEEQLYHLNLNLRWEF